MRAKLIPLLFAAYVGTSHATLVEIDFSSLSPGDIVTDQFSGVTFSLLGSAPIDGPLVVNPGSTQTAGSGGNLITPGDRGTPTCCLEPFYDIQIDFVTTIDFFSILALDAESSEAFTLTAFLGGSVVAAPFATSVIGSFSIPTSGGPIRENTLGSIDGGLLFDRILIDLTELDGPEVWDDIRFNTVSVPEPGTLSLLAMGLLGFAARGFRARREPR